MQKEDRSAVVYVAAAVPGLLVRLSFSYLRMRRQAVKAERRFYRSLLAEGLDRRTALDLAAEYSDPMSITYWIKQKNLRSFGASPKDRKG